MIEDYKFQLNELKTEISNVYEKLDTDSVEKKIKEKEQITENPGFWDNHEKAEKIMQRFWKKRCMSLIVCTLVTAEVTQAGIAGRP